MDAVSRFAARSITTQITMIVAASVLVGLVATILSLVILWATSSPSKSPVAIAVRIAYVTRTVGAAGNEYEADIVLAAIRKSGIVVDAVPISALRTLPRRESRSIWPGPLVGRLKAEPGITVLDGLRYPLGPKKQVILRLDEAHALVFDATTRASPWPFFFTSTAVILTFALVFVLLLLIYAARWIVAPLAAVAEAALSFGRSPDDDRTVSNRGPREITQVADALNEMRTHIRGLLADRTRMLAAISHDLRTPLTRLRLRSERVSNSSLREGMFRDLADVSRMLDETSAVPA